MSAPAPTWVLLRGLARECGHWGGFPACLNERLQVEQAGARLLLLDLPGNGVLYADRSPSRISEMVESCRVRLAQLGVTGPVHLLAMSLGAMVAADWAARYPQELSAAVLINTSLRPFSPFYRRLRPLNYLNFWVLSVSKLSLRQREAMVLRMTTQLQTDADLVLDHWVALQEQHPVQLRNVVRQLWAAARFQGRRLRPQTPVLLLCSMADQLVDWRCSQAISRAWGAPLRLHSKAGHDLPLDDPVWVAQAIADWLRQRRAHRLEEGAWE